jgi:hypothetical protein
MPITLHTLPLLPLVATALKLMRTHNRLVQVCSRTLTTACGKMVTLSKLLLLLLALGLEHG